MQMFCEKRGGANSWTQTSTLAFESLPLEASAGDVDHQPVIERRNSRLSIHPHEIKTEHHSVPDNSLTSLSWLQNLKALDMFSPEVRVRFLPPSPCSEDGVSWETVSSSSTSPGDKQDGSDTRPPLSPIHKCIVQSAQFKLAPKRYRNDPTKPPYSYTSLVYLALQHSRSGKSSLHDICRWIRKNFKFFREAENGWQSSIRQTLSLEELFSKVPRSNGESNKGSYWTINPQWKELFSRDPAAAELTRGGRKLKKAFSYSGDRRQSGPTRKRTKSENQIPGDPCGLPGDLDWISLLSSQRVCRPVYGSPILGPADLGHVGESMTCSPLVVPATIASGLSPSTPVAVDTGKAKELEEDVFYHDSPLPSPHLLTWADSQPQSPCLHPWAESKETTLKNLGRQSRQLTSLTSHNGSVWSPEPGYSSSCLATTCNSITHLSHRHKHRTASSGDSYIY